MRSTTYPIDSGALFEVSLVELGGSSGMVWRAPEITLVGLGEPTVLELGLEAGTLDAAQAHLAGLVGSSVRDPESDGLPGRGPVGFTSLPFDRAAHGKMVIPPVVVGEAHGVRFATSLTGESLDHIEERVAEVLGAAKVAAGDDSRPRAIQMTLDRSAESWRDEVITVARDRLRATDLQKAVLARLLTLEADRAFPLAPIVSNLAERFGHAYVFAIDGFVGASPELLVSRVDRTVRAHPLAGTAARSADAEIDAHNIAALLASSKDRVEHQITIDWLLEELLAFCSYVDAEPEPSVLTLANVHHLGTLVEGVLSEPAASVLDLVSAVHPTPALGGDPQADALALIGELEGFDRGRYGGPTGWVDASGNGQFAVSVRTAQVDGATAKIAAGVGVVAQSDPQAELEETQAKFRAMLGTFFIT